MYSQRNLSETLPDRTPAAKTVSADTRSIPVGERTPIPSDIRSFLFVQGNRAKRVRVRVAARNAEELIGNRRRV